MIKIIDSINRVIAGFLIFLMAAMVLDVTWQVFTRFILKNPSSFTEELAGFLLIWIGLLGSSYALYTRAHLGIDILTYKTTGLKRKIVEIVIYLIVIAFAFFVLVVGGYNLVRMTFHLNQISSAMGIKVGYVYLVIPITGLLFILYSIGFIIEAVKKERLVTERKITDSV
ncbi:MAG: TRAP transporter small permease [Calditrichaeota bacterium]|nr:TRAP transporter small permease [Calditrichota bacterium]